MFGGDGVRLANGNQAPSPQMISRILETGDARSVKLATAIQNGKVEIVYSKLDGLNGRYFPGTNQIELNQDLIYTGNTGLKRAATITAHEGQHFFDDISGVKNMSNKSYLEARAFLAEQKFADSIGKPELGTIYENRVLLGENGSLATRFDAWDRIKTIYGFK
ncbi:MAG: hypothetical protein OEZ58_14915 [Gammaproteobacteria bacterium]|nr:hypothetical protein [Gammaproteobacteria bacterium]MDH5730286.1 hypothetical protein [Gammaproteobacteria bacterium]